MRRILFIIFLLFPAAFLVGQNAPKSNSSNQIEYYNNYLTFELGGATILYSINYFRKIRVYNEVSVGLRIGYSVIPPIADWLAKPYIPIGAYLHFDNYDQTLSAGFVYTKYANNHSELFNKNTAAMMLEFRYSKRLKKRNLELGFQLLYIFRDKSRYDSMPWIGFHLSKPFNFGFDKK